MTNDDQRKIPNPGVAGCPWNDDTILDEDDDWRDLFVVVVTEHDTATTWWETPRGRLMTFDRHY